MTRRNAVISGLTIVLVIFAAGLAFDTIKLFNDEHQTCVIQARGLPAGHELAASMNEIHALLTLRPTSKAQKLAARNEPVNVRRIVRNLNRHLAAYQVLEASQPPTRHC